MNNDSFDPHPADSGRPISRSNRGRGAVLARSIDPSVGRATATDRAWFKLTAAPMYRASIQLLENSFVEMLRTEIHAKRRTFADLDLENFLRSVFDDDLVVESYFPPSCLMLPRPEQGRVTFNAKVTPFDVSLKAANVAASTRGLSWEEKRVAYSASLVYSSGLYHSVHPVVFKNGRASRVALSTARETTALLLEDALRGLRARNPLLGAKMTAAVTGRVNDEEWVSPQLLAKLHGAVHLSNMPALRTWLDAEGWADVSIYS